MARRRIGGALIVELQAMELRQQGREGMHDLHTGHAAAVQRTRSAKRRRQVIRIGGCRRGVRSHARSSYTGSEEGEAKS